MMPSEAVLVPLYYDLRDLGLTDSLWAVVLPQVAQSVAFGTFWMRAWFRSANRSLVEAARLDGASTWRVLWQVLVPLARPAVVTLTVLVFMWTWNEFLIPLVMVVSENLRTAPLGLAFFQGQYTAGVHPPRGRRRHRRDPRRRCSTCSSSATSSRGCSRAPCASRAPGQRPPRAVEDALLALRRPVRRVRDGHPRPEVRGVRVHVAVPVGDRTRSGHVEEHLPHRHDGEPPHRSETSGPRSPSRSHAGRSNARSEEKKITGSEACWR